MAFDRNNLFKPDKRSKAEVTDNTARTIVETETRARQKKNTKLRALRLEREAAEKAAAPTTKKKARASTRKTGRA